ncbi:MAG TPA: hypothetical protein VK498_09515, partial [Ferruginibacter sp.]|nr:hypothetical protein [Ferruginibacter sp.]
MASQFGQRIVLFLLLSFATSLHAQTVYYPAQSSDLLKSTSLDIADLFQLAIPEAQFTSKPYTLLPGTGIILIYDSSIVGDQSCKIESDGKNFIKFSASQDNGICYGIYTYLRMLG